VITSFSSLLAQKSLYDFKVNDIDGKPFNLGTLKGKKVLIVNVASKCGYTPQYEELQQLYEKYSDKDFVILGFPANNFGSQEPGTNAEIKTFCTSRYHVTFPMMAKISVSGDDIDPLYAWLTSKDQNGKVDAPVKWNFFKFMIDKNGQVVDFAPSGVKPLDPKITGWITK
jgi:glutathione peroxidase